VSRTPNAVPKYLLGILQLPRVFNHADGQALDKRPVASLRRFITIRISNNISNAHVYVRCSPL
jgi:hypothetical protein